MTTTPTVKRSRAKKLPIDSLEDPNDNITFDPENTPQGLTVVPEIVHNTDVPMMNAIEEAMRSGHMQDSTQDAMLQLALGQRDKTALLKNVVSPQDLMSELNPDQRNDLPMVYMLAECPFYSLRDFYRDHKKPDEWSKLEQKVTIPELKGWADRFVRYGLMVNRKGREEDIKAVAAMFTEGLEVRTGNQGVGKI